MEDALGEGSHLLDRLRKGLFQQAAMLELILSRWCEAPRDEALHLSTLVQQCLSVVAERGGISPSSLYRLLCRGPFARVDRERFVQFLRVMGEQKILVSAEDGSLLAGEAGERMLAHYSFYAAFATTEEYRIVCDGKTLGTLPIEGPVLVDGTIVFAARRWRVDSIDESVRVIQVKRAETGKAPVFGSEEHYGYREEIRIRMRSLYEQVSVPPYLDEGARRLWGQGQTEYTVRDLESNSIVAEGTGSVLFLWDSDHAALTLSALLGTLGISAEGDGFALEIESVRPSDVQSALKALAREPNWPTGYELAQRIGNKELEKHDRYLGPDLLAWEYAAKMFDIPGARRLVTRLTQSR
jgi:ATP-dependent Lhr-like helicase